jgi:hypothetical protein
METGEIIIYFLCEKCWNQVFASFWFQDFFDIMVLYPCQCSLWNNNISCNFIFGPSQLHLFLTHTHTQRMTKVKVMIILVCRNCTVSSRKIGILTKPQRQVWQKS